MNTPETQQADCDLALGLLVQAVANSRYASDTLIIVTEDDVQDGPDHVDSHRAPALVIGPYVKQGVVVSTRYSQVSVLRTIEDILGTRAPQPEHRVPAADGRCVRHPFRRQVDVRRRSVNGPRKPNTTLLPAQGNAVAHFASGPVITPQHDAAYWANVTKGFDFSEADQVPPAQFNRVLWKGLMGNKPYPAVRGVATTDDDEREKRKK